MLLQLWKFAQENKIIIRPIDIFTDWNVADNPSRGKRPTRDLAERTIEVLKGAPSRPDVEPSKEQPSGYLPVINSIEVPDYLETAADTMWSKIMGDLYNNIDDNDFVIPDKKRNRE